MSPPGKRFRLTRVEALTVLLIAAIATAVLLPRCRPPAHDAPPTAATAASTESTAYLTPNQAR